MHKLARYLLATTALVPLALLPVQANPLDPNVVAGSAAISGQGTADLTVDQTTNKAIIDWRSFDIGVGEATRFNQPGSQSVTLNRIIGGEGASQILGTLKANGHVFLINPDGILFGKDAMVDVGGLVATTHDLSNADFMAGNYRFDQSGNPAASIVNLGTITVEDQGFAALVAPGVRNAGTIRANLGKIGLASADGFTLDFYGDELIQLAVDDSTAGNVIDLATGETLHDLVSNSGLLSANGGTVQLTASAARAVVNSVINNTGNIEANTVGTRNGKIILGAATASTKLAGAPVQSVKVSGTLSAAGDSEGETGGTIQITGELIELTVATIDAFGWNGGGKVLIGGDYMGGNGDPAVIAEHDIELETYDIPTAAYVFADERSSISASAIQNGDGGKIILWSDVATVTAAELQARGGADGGDGGFIETSGKYLSALGTADASAPDGKAGTWLLDPINISIEDGPEGNFAFVTETIYPGIIGDSAFPTASPSVISTSRIEAALNTGTNVRVITRNTVGGDDGHIFIRDDVHKTAGGDVFVNINAAGNVYFSSGVDLTSTSGEVTFHVYATDGQVFGNNVGEIDVNGGQFLIEARNGVDFNSTFAMPDLFTLSLNSTGAPTVSRVDIDVAFAGDTIGFYYENGVGHVQPNGIQLLGASGGELQLTTHGIDLLLYDRAIRVGSSRGITFTVDSSHGFGIPGLINGIPELISESPWVLGPVHQPVSGVVSPLVEVSDDGGLNSVDRVVATSNVNLSAAGVAPTYTTAVPGYQPTIFLNGTGLNMITEVRWTWSGPNSGEAVWNAANGFSGARLVPGLHGTAATLAPRLVVQGDPRGIYAWTVTLTAANGQTVTIPFTLKYLQNQPIPDLPAGYFPSPDSGLSNDPEAKVDEDSATLPDVIDWTTANSTPSLPPGALAPILPVTSEEASALLPYAVLARDVDLQGPAANLFGFRLDNETWSDILKFQGIDPEIIAEFRDSGFEARIYLNEFTGEVVVAFKSSVPLKNWGNKAHWNDWARTNFPELIGVTTPQYAAAAVLAQAVAERYSGTLTLVGFSKGGGQASYAGAYADKVVTFDGARNPDSAGGTSEEQINVIVPGDVVGDPRHLIDGFALPGTTVSVNSEAPKQGGPIPVLDSLPVVGDYFSGPFLDPRDEGEFVTHSMDGIIGGLLSAAGGQ